MAKRRVHAEGYWKDGLQVKVPDGLWKDGKRTPAPEPEPQVIPDGFYENGSPSKIPNGFYLGGKKSNVPDGYWKEGKKRSIPDGFYSKGKVEDIPDGLWRGGKKTSVNESFPDGFFIKGKRAKIPDGFYVSGERLSVPDGYWKDGVLSQVPDGLWENGNLHVRHNESEKFTTSLPASVRIKVSDIDFKGGSISVGFTSGKDFFGVRVSHGVAVAWGWGVQARRSVTGRSLDIVLIASPFGGQIRINDITIPMPKECDQGNYTFEMKTSGGITFTHEIEAHCAG